MARPRGDHDHEGILARLSNLERSHADLQQSYADLQQSNADLKSHAESVETHLLHPHQRIVLRHVLARSEQAVITQKTGVSRHELTRLKVRDLSEGEAYVIAHPRDTRISEERIVSALAVVERLVPRPARERVRLLARSATHSDDIVPCVDQLRQFRQALDHPDDADAVVSLYLSVFPGGIHAAALGGGGYRAAGGRRARGGGGGRVATAVSSGAGGGAFGGELADALANLQRPVGDEEEGGQPHRPASSTREGEEVAVGCPPGAARQPRKPLRIYNARGPTGALPVSLPEARPLRQLQHARKRSA